MAVRKRLREIFGAIKSAKFPAPPRRRYDLIGEMLANPFSGNGGSGPTRVGGVKHGEGENNASNTGGMAGEHRTRG